jgi:tetratricopeptide (TPR) repeat protein
MALPLSAIGKSVELLVKHGPKAWAKVRELYEGHNPADGLGGLEAVWATACGDFFRSLADHPGKAHLARALKYETVDDAALESHLRGLWAHWETLMRRHSTGPSATDDVDGALAALTESWPVADDPIRQQLTGEFDGWLHRNLPGYIAGNPQAFAKSTLDAFRELPKRVADEFESRRSHAAQPPTAVPAYPPEIRGREDEIDAALKLLESHPFVALSGLSGVGKSVIQLHVAARWYGEHKRGVAQLSGAGTPEELLTRLEDRFSLPHDGDESARIDRLRPAIARVVGLLALDGVDDETTLKLGRKLAAANGSVRVIVSTIRRNTPTESWVVPIELPGTDLARAILAQYAGTVLPNADELIAACGALPMALRIVGGIAAEWGADEALRAVHESTFTSKTDDEKDGSHKSLDGLLLFLMKKLEASSSIPDRSKPFARDALGALGLLGGDRIDPHVFLWLTGMDEPESNLDCLSYWARYSLICFRPGDGHIEVHGLIRRAAMSVCLNDSLRRRWQSSIYEMFAKYDEVPTGDRILFFDSMLKPISEHIEAVLFTATVNDDEEYSRMNAINRWAHGLRLGGNLRSAVRWELMLVEYARRNDIPRLLAAALGNIADSHMQTGDLAGAERWFLEAYQVSVDIGDDPDLAIRCNNLSQVYFAMNRYEDSERWLLDAIRLDERARRTDRLSTRYNNMSLIFKARGQLGAARKWLKRSIRFAEMMEDDHERAISYNNMGKLLQAQGRLDDAIRWMNKALYAFAAIGDDVGLAKCYFNVAFVMSERGLSFEALDAMESSWDLLRDTDDSVARRESAIYLAFAYQMMGRSDEARQVRVEGNVAALEAAEKEKQGL